MTVQIIDEPPTDVDATNENILQSMPASSSTQDTQVDMPDTQVEPNTQGDMPETSLY